MSAATQTGGAVAQSESDTNLTSRRRAWQQRALDDRSRALIGRDADAFLHQSVSSPCLNAIARAEGIWIEDVAGRRYMDFHGNNVHHIGYGHPRLKKAIADQMDALAFAPRRYACETAVELAEKLGAIAPGALSKVLLTTGGSDANEVAIKLARAATGRFKTLSFWDAFHGAGIGASALSGEALFRSGPLAPLVAGAQHVAPFACYRCPYGHDCDADGAPRLELCRMACANMVDYVLEREGDVAAVIAEPARCVPYLPPPGYWKRVQEACRRHGALLIFDEIPTGLGKTGRLFACEHDNVVPDILVMGKALGGGILPIAACIARPELDVAGDWAFGHYTHEKNPVTTRAALTTIQIIEDEGLVENAARMGELALDRMQEMKRRLPSIGDVRGRGLMLGIELVKSRVDKTPDADLAEAVLYRALDRGLSFKTTMGNVLTLTPPLTVSAGQMLGALDIIEEAISACIRA
ncbi:MAG: (R)-1-hydroxy-2-aminoethylphosphonate ammonia-lyase [Bordetella sp.]|uniref:(R)-1-hydroxy-2-aminoethylphosphonate ammonia-lyase n=1 Tax=Bordetella sp. TaxID=28081 RepID=UPI003F7C20D0